jgi:hypothetical protein
VEGVWGAIVFALLALTREAVRIQYSIWYGIVIVVIKNRIVRVREINK